MLKEKKKKKPNSQENYFPAYMSLQDEVRNAELRGQLKLVRLYEDITLLNHHPSSTNGPCEYTWFSQFETFLPIWILNQIIPHPVGRKKKSLPNI